MATGVRVNNYAIKEEQEYKIKTSLQSFEIMSDIKKEMYNQAKIEGAWFLCKIFISKNMEYILEFDYDDKNLIPEDHLIDSDDFKEEFKKYPRGREYTPIWWQNILGRRAKYIK